ncbi:MAG: FGGY-family carbohydrate kinase, partial [Oscillospiraceae bacterium]
ANGFLMQFQADILGRTVTRPENVESTATGAAYLAGLGCGMWSGKQQLLALSGSFDEFRPAMDEQKRTRLLSGWKNAVATVIGK